MNFDQFTPLAIRTESVIPPIKLNPVVFDSVVDACVIVGNLADFIKKNAAYNKPIDIAKWNELVARLSAILPFIEELTAESFVSNDTIDINTRLFHGIFGMFTESTELMEALQIAKEEKSWDGVNLAEECADLSWYQVLVMDEIKISMSSALEACIEKLKARFPQKYSDESAINRNVTTERSILERNLL